MGLGFGVYGAERERESERASERDERREKRGRDRERQGEEQEREKPSSTMGGFIPRTARTGPAWMPAN